MRLVYLAQSRTFWRRFLFILIKECKASILTLIKCEISQEISKWIEKSQMTFVYFFHSFSYRGKQCSIFSTNIYKLIHYSTIFLWKKSLRLNRWILRKNEMRIKITEYMWYRYISFFFLFCIKCSDWKLHLDFEFQIAWYY